MYPSKKVLIIDDDLNFAEHLKARLQPHWNVLPIIATEHCATCISSGRILREESCLREKEIWKDSSCPFLEDKDLCCFDVALVDLVLPKTVRDSFQKILERTSEGGLLPLAKLKNLGGYKILREIKKTYVDSEVIMVSRIRDRRFIISAIQLEAFGYVVKDPIERHVPTIQQKIKKLEHFKLGEGRDVAEEIIKLIKPVPEEPEEISIPHSAIDEVALLVEKAYLSRIKTYTRIYLPDEDFINKAYRKPESFFIPKHVNESAIIVYIDIRNSANLWERSRGAPIWVDDKLNHIFEIIHQECYRHSGCIDVFIGDAALILFDIYKRVPLSKKQEDQIKNVTRKALNCVENIKKRFLSELSRWEIPSLDIGLRFGVISAERSTSMFAHVGAKHRKQLTIVSEQMHEVTRILSELSNPNFRELLTDSDNPIVLIGSIIKEVLKIEEYKSRLNLFDEEIEIKGLFKPGTNEPRKLKVAELNE